MGKYGVTGFFYGAGDESCEPACMMKCRIFLMLMGALSLLFLPSCLEVEQVITLKKDGSGTISEEIVMGAKIVAMLEGLPGGAGAENPFADLYDPEKYKAKASDFGKGVAYSRMEKIERNGGKGVKAVYTFEDINNVTLTPGSPMQELDKEEKGPKDDPLKFAYAGGVLTVTTPEPTAEILESAEDAEEVDEGVAKVANEVMEAMMVEMFKGMKISTKLVTSTGIQKSDASYLKDDTITLLLMDFDEIMKNPKGLQAMQKLEGAKRGDIAESLKGVKGVAFETKKKVRVKLR